MNEFNPFETLGIDPNESMSSRTSLDTQTQINPMETMWQFNPFEQLNINVNGFQQPTANGKDTEVSSMLGINQFTPMTDDEKQTYVDALSEEDWNTWNQLKDEGYSFEARKALMENQDMLYDINEVGTWKYLQTHQSKFINTLTKAKQTQLDFYQNKVAGWSDRASEKMDQLINREPKWIGVESNILVKKDPYTWQKFLNVANSVLSKMFSGLEHLTNLVYHGELWLYNSTINKINPTYEKVSWDASKDTYESKIASAIWLGNDVLWSYFAVKYPIATTAFGIVAQNDWFIAQWLNWVDKNLTRLVNKVFDIPLMQEWIQQPWNAGIEQDLTEGITQWIYLLLMAKSKKAFGRTKAWIKLNEIRGKVGEWVKNSIRRGKEAGDRSKSEMMNIWEVTPEWEFTNIAKENISNATKQWMKYGRKEVWNKKPVESKPTELWLPEDKTSITPKDWIINPTEGWPTISNPEITEITEKSTKNEQTSKTNDNLTQLAKDTKLSENTIKNLESNPDLQTEFKNTIKPYLETNGKNNPEWVISESVNNLIYDIKAWIDELKVQQANLNRSINNQKLTPVEKALIKEIEKIINKKEPKPILNWLKKLTPEQLWLLERTVPNLGQRINTIWQMLDLTMEITKNDLIWRFLRFQAERPRKGITWFAKKLLFDYVKDLYDQKWIQLSTKSIDKFIDGLSDQQKSDIVKTIEDSNWELSDSVKKSLSDLVNEMEVEGEPTEIRRLSESEKTEDIKRNRDQLEDEWYTPETRLYTVDKNWKLVSHETSKELEIKPFGSNKPLKDIFKTAWVNLTIPSELIFKIRYAKDADWVYIWDKDLIAIPWKSVAVWVLAHEFGHRVMSQLTENEKLKIIEDIKKKNYWMTDRAAEERFAEYFRNYFLYWNINWVTALETFTTAVWQKAWQRIVNIMEKTKMDLFADLWANSEIDMYQKTKSIDKMIDSIYKLTEKGKEIIQRQPEQGSRAEAEAEAARNISTLEKFSKSDIPQDLDLSEIKNATNELKNIRVNDDWYIVWDYHWHETPVYDYIEDSNLPKDIKKYLKEQETSYLEEQDKGILDRLEELEKDSLFQWNDWEIKYSSEWNLKLGPWYYFGWRKQAWEFGKNVTKLEKQEGWKLYEPKDTQTYQVEASNYGWKEKYNEYLKEQGYDWIKAMNKAFWDYEYNFFIDPTK